MSEPVGARLAASRAALTREQVFASTGVLLVTRLPPPVPPPVAGQPPSVAADPADGPELFLAVWDDGEVTAYCGHVDLGTGIRTALAQIVAEELDVALERVSVVLGDTARAPNQGATIASASIQISAVPLRQAAAQARAFLRSQPEGAPSLLLGRRIELSLSDTTPVKPVADYHTVGRDMPRVDIPEKATGALTFVHDMRVPGMLHGRVVRPPYAGLDSGEFVGRSLRSVDEASIAHIPGIVAVVVIADFIGIVAEREEHAEQAARELRVDWKSWAGPSGGAGAAPLEDLAEALRKHPGTRRELLHRGDVDAALAQAALPMPRTYVWPYQLHGAIGPSCALADWRDDAAAPGLTVWSGTQGPHGLRADLALLLGLPECNIEIVRMEAAGCYGRNCADDVCADAALLSRAVNRPVRVQLTREQEHQWEPKGAAQLMQVEGGLNADGSVAAYDFSTSYPSNGAPTLALLLTGAVAATPQVFEMGDRTAVPPYDYANLRVAARDMVPIVRASWLRGVSALPNSFAHESYIDELATAAGADPVAFRLLHLKDERATDLVRSVVERAGWRPHTAPQQQPAQGEWQQGQGVAYARYVHSRYPGFGAAWAAWVADVEVNARTGEVHVKRIVVGHDAGLMINPAGVQQQIHGNVIQTTSRALKERVAFDDQAVAINREWGSYPILNFREVPVIDVMMMPRPDQPPLGAGESSSVPGTAAIANAIFDATGVRFRQPPFTPDVVRAGLAERAGAGASALPGARSATLPAPDLAVSTPPPAPPATGANGTPPTRRRRVVGTVLALAAGLLGLGAAALGWRSAIAPAAPPSAGLFSAETLQRGQVLAALGNCNGCHTAPGGAVNAGGLALHTPFGSIVSSNITPDVQTGIGSWSLAAFLRAMRDGVARDGRHLYPAFPYTAYTQVSDDDLTALYAHLMAQPAVRHQPAETHLAFPFSVRPLLALWNGLFLDPGPRPADPAQSAEWNRGAYLVEGLGHCGGCHTPRNALGAERGAASYLAGAVVDGWEAPALTTLAPSSARAPVPWTVDSLFQYLRHGHSRQHGSAGGPMAGVVVELQKVPDADLRAMAVYLADFNAPASVADVDAAERVSIERAAAEPASATDGVKQLFRGACGACHHDGSGPRVEGLNLPLALNGKLHSARPDNLLQVILHGVPVPALAGAGPMPAFKHALSDAQIAELAAYLRARFASEQPAWAELPAAVARVRNLASKH